MGTGEKTDALEVFHPDRLAGRILGMGDVVTLVERAQETFDAKQAEKLADKMRRNAFTLEDFLDQMQQVKKMGPLSGIIEHDPGLGGAAKEAQAGHRPWRARQGRGDHPLDDAGGAERPRDPQWVAPPPDRARLRDQPPGGQPTHQAVRRDAAGDAPAPGPGRQTTDVPDGTFMIDDDLGGL